MTAPPGFVALPSIRRNESAEPHEAAKLTGETCAVLDRMGVRISPSKVSRLVHRYVERVQHTGYGFAEWIANGIALDAVQRRIVADELTRVVAYSDPTGETASRNVDQERGL